MSRPTADEAALLLHHWTGGAQPALLGQGMEGLVFEVPSERVAKVWYGESQASLERTKAFYDALDAKPFPFAVPRIHRYT